MAGGAQGEKASAVAWLGASERTQMRVGHHLDGWLQWTRAFLKPTLTSVALRRTRGASRVKKHPGPAWARRSKPGLSEYRLVAGIEPAKSQVPGHADDLQPSGGHGRLRHRTASEKPVECMREKVN